MYGVMLEEAKSANAGATETKRQQIRDERLAKAAVPTKNGAHAANGQEGGDQIGGYVTVKDGEASCARCDQGFGPMNGNFKQYLAVEETSITEAGPLFVDPKLYVDDDRVRLYRSYCPNCATLLSVTVARTDDEVLGEFEISSGIKLAGNAP